MIFSWHYTFIYYNIGTWGDTNMSSTIATVDNNKHKNSKIAEPKDPNFNDIILCPKK